MHRRERFAHPKDDDALGLVLGRYKGLNTVWYAGGDLGFSSYMLRFPDQRTTVFVLSNRGDGNTTKYARAVADLVLDSAFLRPAPARAATRTTRTPCARCRRAGDRPARAGRPGGGLSARARWPAARSRR
jgi:hypothetical protein